MSTSAVTEVTRALGSWSLTLRDAPQSLLDTLAANLLGHLAIDTSRDNPAVLGDNLRRSARYVGPLRGIEYQGGTAELSGCGMAFWLGDEDRKGSVLETQVSLSGASFSAAISALLPSNGDVIAGDIGGISDSYTGKHQYQSPREAIDYVADTMGADWIVRGDATLDAGPTSTLFPTTDAPTAAVIRRAVGTDMTLRALPGEAKLARDVEDFTTRVVTLAEGNGASVRVGQADIAPGLNVYKNMFGAPVKLTRMVSESNTSLTNANARAQLQLNRFTSTRDALDLSTSTHDIRGDVAAGDSVWVFDPDSGLIDYDNEIVFRGERIFPVKLRVYELSWPVVKGMGVYFRTGDGVWLDLSDYVRWETGTASIKVGGYDRSLTNSTQEPVGSRVVADSSIPAAPTLTLPWTTSVYQSGNGFSRARILTDWAQPLNTDGSSIVDGSHYEVQVKPTSGSEWTTQAVGFDQSQASIAELLPATSYDVRIRAVDTASPPNFGAWSTTETVVSAGDTIAPSTPAVATVFGNPVSIQVSHTLGIAAGGTYNLEPDLAALEVHGSTSGAGFTESSATLIGKMVATQGMMTAGVKAIGTFTVDSTAELWIKVVAVDESGNRSAASAAVNVTPGLVDSVHISTVTATQVDTGTFSATYGVTGLFISGNPSAARFESGTRGALQGGRTYRPSGTLALQLDALTGDLTTYQTNGTTKTFQIEASTGNVYLYKSDGTTAALSLTASTGALSMLGALTVGATIGSGDRIELTQASGYPTAFFYDASSGTNRAYVNGVLVSGNRMALGLNSGEDTSGNQTTLFLQPSNILLQYNTFAGTPNVKRGGFFEANSGGAAIGHAPSGTTVSRVATGSTTVTMTSPDGVLVVGSGAVVADVPFGDTGAGMSFVPQLGGSDGIRFYADGSYLRFVQNGTNTFLPDPTGPGGLKAFVIDHPVPGNDDRWLVHIATESPDARVTYEGEAVLTDGHAEVRLPHWFEHLCQEEGRTVHVTMLVPDEPLTESVPGPVAPAVQVPLAPRADGDHQTIPERALLHPVAASVPRNGGFRVVSPAPNGTRVSWLVSAIRRDTNVDPEPLRATTDVRGFGPYRFIVPPTEEIAA